MRFMDQTERMLFEACGLLDEAFTALGDCSGMRREVSEELWEFWIAHRPRLRKTRRKAAADIPHHRSQQAQRLTMRRRRGDRGGVFTGAQPALPLPNPERGGIRACRKGGVT